MSDKDTWHDEDRFWETFEPILFNPERLSDAEAEVDQLLALLDLSSRAHILDLCCGTGRHSLVLARRGFDVVGVDRTASFIEKARGNAENEDLSAEFVIGDMRGFKRPDRFEAVLNLFGSFGYFENPDDDRRVVRNMHASLRAGGKLLIETMGKEIALQDFRERDWSEEDDRLVLAERRPTENWSRIQTRWIVIQGSERFERTVSVRSYSAAELLSLLAGVGFADLQVYGSLDGRSYDLNAKRLVVVGTKPAS
jgi:SAM-dependent methyltransferase